MDNCFYNFYNFPLQIQHTYGPSGVTAQGSIQMDAYSVQQLTGTRHPASFTQPLPRIQAGPVIDQTFAYLANYRAQLLGWLCKGPIAELCTLDAVAQDIYKALAAYKVIDADIFIRNCLAENAVIVSALGQELNLASKVNWATLQCHQLWMLVCAKKALTISPVPTNKVPPQALVTELLETETACCKALYTTGIALVNLGYYEAAEQIAVTLQGPNQALAVRLGQYAIEAKKEELLRRTMDEGFVNNVLCAGITPDTLRLGGPETEAPGLPQPGI